MKQAKDGETNCSSKHKRKDKNWIQEFNFIQCLKSKQEQKQ